MWFPGLSSLAAGQVGQGPAPSDRLALRLCRVTHHPFPSPCLFELASPFAHLFHFSVLPKHSEMNSVFFPLRFQFFTSSTLLKTQAKFQFLLY